MSENIDTVRHERLIAGLRADLTPVARLRGPFVSALLWLAGVGAVAAALAMFSPLDATAQRLTAAPDMWLAALGSTLTAAFGAIATFQLVVPDRKPVWALLPVPALLVWIGASGWGCLRTWLLPGTHEASLKEATDCLVFILGLSVPLSAALILMLRRGYSLRPNLTALSAGLSVAATAASLLTLFHPFDAAATDLAVHALAVVLVIAGYQVFAHRLSGKK